MPQLSLLKDGAQRHHRPSVAPAAGLPPGVDAEERAAGAAARGRRLGDGQELGGDGSLGVVSPGRNPGITLL